LLQVGSDVNNKIMWIAACGKDADLYEIKYIDVVD